MVRKLKAAFGRVVRDEALLMGLVFGVLVFAAIVSGLLAPHHLGTVDSGKYEKIMDAAGLRYTHQRQAEGELLYVKVIEEYDYAHFSYAKLFAPNQSGSIVYPVALIRLLTKPFGLAFSTQYLYLLYAVITGLAVFMIVRGAAALWRRFGVIAGIALLMLFSDRNLTAYFGSLYETGTVIVALTLFAGCALRALSYRRGEGMDALWPVVLSGAFLLSAVSRAIVFLPAVLVAAAGLAVREWESIRRHGTQAAIAALILVCATYSSACYLAGDSDNTSRAAAYHAVFQGILPASENPREDIEQLGLDASFLEDTGKSFYQESGDFAHDPKRPEEAERIFSALSTGKVLRWYLAHPRKALRTVLGSVSGMNSLETGWTLAADGSFENDRQITRGSSLIGLLGRALLPEGYAFLLFTSGVVALLSVALWIWRVWSARDGKRARWLEPALLIALAAGVALYLPLHIALMGVDSLELDRVVSVYCLIAMWGGLLLVAGKAAGEGSVWFRRIYEEESPEPEQETVECEERGDSRLAPGLRGRLAGAVAAVASSRRRTVLAVLALALVMVCSIQFAKPRAGSVNNGDYGRMMDQLGLTWTGEYYYNTDAQAGKGIIEEYAYRSAFDPATLTSLKPTYSLVYPVAIVRGLCALTGARFSTWYVSLVMSAALMLCILSIVRDLYQRMGPYTLILGVLLCLIFLCESEQVWFNSLFGEGCMLLGVMMLVACCVHLSVAPQGKATVWVFALAFSAMFLTTAKAQMTVALPVVLTLFLVFAFYHRPLHVSRLVVYTLACMICTGLISYKTVRIYANNNTVSERQTVWSSIFYGALMLSDDPIGDLEELGLPVEMAADIGKDAYRADEEYYISPNSEEATEILYDHINTFTMVGYYLKRPAALLKILDHLAGQSREVYNGFRVYAGQNYSGEYDAVDRWGVWLYWRPLIALSHFWEYVLLYGSVLVFAVYKLTRRDVCAKDKLLIVTFLGIMLIGSLQYPLTGIGNGFADNHKQMYGFMICHDLMFALGLPALLIWWNRRAARLPELMRRLKAR